MSQHTVISQIQQQIFSPIFLTLLTKPPFFSTANGLSVSGTNNDYWVNSPTVEKLVQKVEITPYAEETPSVEPIEVIGHGGGSGGYSGGMGGGIGGGTGNPGMGGGTDGGGGGEASGVTTVHGVHAKLNSDGVLAIVDNQNEFVLRDRYHADVNGRGYTVTVASTVNDAEKAYSDIEDKTATDQQVTDYLQAVAAGKSYTEIRSDIINSPDMKGIMDGYEQQLYGENADQNTQAWLKDNLKNERSLLDIRWEDAHSQRMTDAIFTMINGVQDRTDASEAYDANYKNATMDALGHKETSFIQNRDSLIDIDAEKTIINDKIYENIHDRTATDGDISFVRDQMHGGLSIQNVIWNEAHNQELNDGLSQQISALTERDISQIGGSSVASIEDIIGNQQITYRETKSFLTDGVQIASASSQDSIAYKVIDTSPSDAMTYTDGQGNQLLLSNKFSLSDVVSAGKAVRQQYEADQANVGIERALVNAKNNFAHYIGQGGVFDIQRNPQSHTFYKPMTPGANYLVGVFSAAAGLNKAETYVLGLGYGFKKSENYSNLFRSDSKYWATGMDDVNSGKVK